MKVELFASDELLMFRPYGEISTNSVSDWSDVFHRHYGSQMKVMMDFRGLRKVSVSVPEFTSVGLADRARANPDPGLRVAYVADSDLIYGFARVIENVWHASVDVSVFRSFEPACEWFDIEPSIWDSLDLKVRVE